MRARGVRGESEGERGEKMWGMRGENEGEGCERRKCVGARGETEESEGSEGRK